jgi:hypothetical protein
MNSTTPQGSLGRGLAVAVSALTLSVFAAVPAAMAATSSHANAHSMQASSQQSTSHGNASTHETSGTSASTHQTSGTSGTSGDTSQPQPLSGADQNSGGANGKCPDGPYCSTRDGSASGNGNGGGQAVGKPCAGCVGKADNKNPPGQYPNGSDANAGYECDSNHGIGRTNPAHTGCTSGETDCTATPEAPECVNTPPDCTDTPNAPECVNTPPDCTDTPNAPECLPGGSGCVATAANHFCTDVLGEQHTRTSTPTTVLGEKVTRTPASSPEALPFTGADIAAMVAFALMALVTGTATLALATRRRSGASS